jgi:hypothetical protein
MTPKRRKDATQASNSEALRVRLPGFLVDEDVGLGDAIKRATSYVGIAPCAGCDRRATALNRWLTFTAKQRR